MALSSDPTYGQHSSDNYVLGRGILKADIYDSTNTKTGRFLDLGNCTNFVINMDEETLEHESSRSGLKTVDASVTLKKSASGSFTLDEITADNLSMFLSGTVDESSQTGTTDADLTITMGILADADQLPGKWYELFDSNGDRIYNLTSLDVKVPAGASYTLTTDYLVDMKRGMVFVVVGGLIDTSEATVFDYDFTNVSGDIQDVQMLQTTVVRAAIYFAGTNAQTGEDFEVRIHSAKISADGDASFIGDEFLSMNFNFIIEEVTDAAHSASPYCTIRKFPVT